MLFLQIVVVENNHATVLLAKLLSKRAVTLENYINFTLLAPLRILSEYLSCVLHVAACSSSMDVVWIHVVVI